MLLPLAFGLSAKAQSTALNPYEGATHTYAWNGLQQGVGYQFYVTADALGSVIYDDGATGEFDFLNGSESGTVGAGGSASAQIAWNNGASLHIYYVWLKVTNSTGCTNFRNVEVIPQVNQFNLLSQNIPENNTRSCPVVAESNGFNPLASAYNAGKTTLHFLVKREFGTDNKLTPAVGDTYDWSFVPGLVVVDHFDGLSNVIDSINAKTTGEKILPVGGRYTISGLNDEAIVSVSIDNMPGSERNVTLQVTLGVESNTNLPDSNPADNNVTHTIKIMPVIEGMGGI